MKTSREHFQAGLAHYRAGELEASIPEYQAALRLDADFWEAHTNLGLAYIDLERYEDATVEFQESMRVNPYDSETYNSLGLVFARLGQHELQLFRLTSAAFWIRTTRSVISVDQSFQQAGMTR